MPQDPILFDETIRGNLLYGNPRATNKDLDTVATLTQLNEVLQRVPGGFDEPLGPLGNRLSGGEKKRLALARTFLQEPHLLILDEITSALDEPAAASLLQGLDLFRKARTLIIISHRPATVLWADRILVVGEGRAVDTGKHDELIRRCPLYQRIWQSRENVYTRIAHSRLYSRVRERRSRAGNSRLQITRCFGAMTVALNLLLQHALVAAGGYHAAPFCGFDASFGSFSVRSRSMRVPNSKPGLSHQASARGLSPIDLIVATPIHPGL